METWLDVLTTKSLVLKVRLQVVLSTSHQGGSFPALWNVQLDLLVRCQGFPRCHGNRQSRGEATRSCNAIERKFVNTIPRKIEYVDGVCVCVCVSVSVYYHNTYKHRHHAMCMLVRVFPTLTCCRCLRVRTRYVCVGRIEAVDPALLGRGRGLVVRGGGGGGAKCDEVVAGAVESTTVLGAGVGRVQRTALPR